MRSQHHLSGFLSKQWTGQRLLTESTLQIFRLQEYLRAARPGDSVSTPNLGGMFVEDPNGKFCEDLKRTERKKSEGEKGGGSQL